MFSLVLAVYPISPPTLGKASPDQRIELLQQFFKVHNCPDYSLDYVGAADINGIDYKILPVIWILESQCAKHELYNNGWGYGSATGLRHFETHGEGIFWISYQLANNHWYKGKTLEQQIKTYNSVNPNYWSNFLKLYNSIK